MWRWLMGLFFPSAPDATMRERTAALQSEVDRALQQLKEQRADFERRNDQLSRTVDSRRVSISESLRQLREANERRESPARILSGLIEDDYR